MTIGEYLWCGYRRRRFGLCVPTAETLITHRLPWVRLHIPVLALGGLLLLAPVCAKARTLHVVALGDSLTEGEGLPRGQAFPDELERALKLKGWDVEVANAGYGGHTAGDALIRYDRFVPEGTDVVIIELGINDMLYGMRPEGAKAALAEILARLQKAHVATLLTGMRATPNLDAEQAMRFEAIYPDLAQSYDVALYPFFLEGVAGDPKLYQNDGQHPTHEGVEKIVAAILPSVESVLESVRQ
jgi:acyl-CoA thioesterase I